MTPTQTYDMSPLPSYQPSALLRLPGELRSNTFEYALTEPEELTYGGYHPDNQGKTLEAYNQLMLTNKSLYEETARLELKYSTIFCVQEYVSKDPPGAQFLCFLRQINATQETWPKNVTLLDSEESPVDQFIHRTTKAGRHLSGSNEHESTMHVIADFCAAHSYTTLTYQFISLALRHHVSHSHIWLHVCTHEGGPVSCGRWSF